jgi:CRISPR-associated endoribonuclease Cas6
MPLHSLIELVLTHPPHNAANLGNAIHGLVHHILADPDPNTATQLHEQQRKSLSLRGYQLQHNVLQLELVMLSDKFTESMQAAFQPERRFGREQDALAGVIGICTHRDFDLESVRQTVQAKAVPQFLRLEFLSPTAFTHKKGTWASPHPSLLFDSLLARWSDFGGQSFELDFGCITKAMPDIYTDTTSIGASPMHAFMGKLDLELTGDVQKRQDLCTLAAFGCIANVGRRVAYGCGAMDGHVGSVRDGYTLNPDSILSHR